MRTKTLLIAAAALAATVISSQAQTVYSQNIVGYANQTISSGANAFLVAPLQGTTNAADVLMPCIQFLDEILVWNGSDYQTWTYLGPGANQPGGTGYGNWNDGVNTTNAPALYPGESYFYVNNQGATETNTFTGTVLLTNSISISSGVTANVGSTPPVAGYADDTNTIALPVQFLDEVLVWNGSDYQTWTYLGPGYNQPGGTGFGNWNDGVNTTNAPYINVGQGFFYVNNQGGSEQWNQNVKVQ